MMKAASMRFSKRILLLIISIIGSLIVLECALRLWSHNTFTRSFRVTPEANVIVILTLGESTTSSEYTDSWPTQLERTLSKAYPSYRFQIINVAVPGATTNTLVGKLESQIYTYKPDIVISMMGINDGDKEGFINTVFMPNRDDDSLRIIRLFRIVHAYMKMSLSHYYNLHISHNTEKLNAMGDQFGIDGSFDLAEKYLVRCIALEPNNAAHYVDLAIMYLRMSRSMEAYTMLMLALHIAPKSEGVYTELGTYFRDTNNPLAATLMYKKALTLNPQYAEAYEAYGLQLSWNTQSSAMAMNMLETSIRYAPNVKTTYMQLASLYDSQGRTEDAIKTYTRLLAIDPNNREVMKELGRFTSRGQVAVAGASAQYAPEIMSEPLHPMTKKNYQKIIEIMDKHNIPLILMQYPLRSADPIRTFVYETLQRPSASVSIIENVTNFQDALKRYTYDELFVDQFAENFGHATALGNSIIADRVAAAVQEPLNQIEIQ